MLGNLLFIPGKLWLEILLLLVSDLVGFGIAIGLVAVARRHLLHIKKLFLMPMVFVPSYFCSCFRWSCWSQGTLSRVEAFFRDRAETNCRSDHPDLYSYRYYYLYPTYLDRLLPIDFYSQLVLHYPTPPSGKIPGPKIHRSIPLMG